MLHNFFPSLMQIPPKPPKFNAISSGDCLELLGKSLLPVGPRLERRKVVRRNNFTNMAIRDGDSREATKKISLFVTSGARALDLQDSLDGDANQKLI